MSRRRERLMMAACLLDVLDEEGSRYLRGRLGSKNIRRTRKDVDDMWKELGNYARKA